jgi:homoserine acetyltransferase
MADPNWNKGFYYKGVPPHIGMKVNNLMDLSIMETPHS